MTRTEAETKIKDLISDYIGEEVRSEQNLVSDVGCDSLDLVEIAMAIEEMFDIEIDDTVAPNLGSINDILDFMQKKYPKIVS